MSAFTPTIAFTPGGTRHPGPWLSLWLLLLVSVSAAQAQEQAKGQEKTTPYAIPEMPALTMVGASATNVNRPVTPRALATELVNGVDSAGRVKQGVAVAIAPFALAGGSATLTEYQTKWFKYVLYNAQLSGGSVRTAGDANATDLGTGVRLTLIDGSDPMRDLTYTNQVRAILLAAMPTTPEGAAAAFVVAKEKVTKARVAWQKEHWNRPGLAIAAASGWRLNQSKVLPSAANRWLGWSTWATGAGPFLGKAGQLVGQVRYTNHQQVERKDGPTETDHELTYGTRLLFGSSTVNFFAELTGYQHSHPLPNVDKSGTEWAGGVEFRAAEGVWISTSVGRKFSQDAGSGNAALLFAGLRWDVANAAHIKAP